MTTETEGLLSAGSEISPDSNPEASLFTRLAPLISAPLHLDTARRNFN